MLNFAHFNIPTLVAYLVTLQHRKVQCHTGKHDQGSTDEQGPPKKAPKGLPYICFCKAMTLAKQTLLPHTREALCCAEILQALYAC